MIMTRKYHNQKSHINLWPGEEEGHNTDRHMAIRTHYCNKSTGSLFISRMVEKLEKTLKHYKRRTQYDPTHTYIQADAH